MERNEEKRCYLIPQKHPPSGARIWSEEVGHNEGASWLEDVEVVLSTIDVQEDISITVEDIRNGVSKMANWKTAGPDLVQGFLFKKLTSLRGRR